MAAWDNSSQKCQAKGEIACNPKPKSHVLLELRMSSGVAGELRLGEVQRGEEYAQNIYRIKFLIKNKVQRYFWKINVWSSNLVEKKTGNLGHIQWTEHVEKNPCS